MTRTGGPEGNHDAGGLEFKKRKEINFIKIRSENIILIGNTYGDFCNYGN